MKRCVSCGEGKLLYMISQRAVRMSGEGCTRRDLFLDYVLCCVLVMNSESVYFKHSDISSAIFEIILTITLIVYLCCSSANRVLSKDDGVFAAVIAGVYSSILLLLFLHGMPGSSVSNTLQKIMLYSIIMPLFLVLVFKKRFTYVKNVLIVRYVNVMSILAFIGLLLWALSVAGLRLPSIPFSYQWGGGMQADGILGLTYTVQYSDQAFASGLPRYTMFFVEGPIAISYFALTAIMEITCNPHPRPSVILLLEACMICSFTSFGMMLAAPIAVLALMTSKRVKATLQKSYIAYYLYWVFVVTAVVVAPMVSFRLLSQKTNTSSADLHVADFVAGYRAFRNSPLFGYGIGNYEPLHTYSDIGVAGQSSAMMMGLVQGGMLLVGLIILPMVLALVKCAYRKEYTFALLIIFTLLFYINGLSDNSPIFALLTAVFIVYAFYPVSVKTADCQASTVIVPENIAKSV